MSRWDLARARSQQPARKYKVCGPVGERQDSDSQEARRQCLSGGGYVPTRTFFANYEVSACSGCGYHVCSCQPEYVPHMFRPKPTPPASIKARLDTLERLQGLGMLDTPARREAVYRVLLDGDYSGFGVKP